MIFFNIIHLRNELQRRRVDAEIRYSKSGTLNEEKEMEGSIFWGKDHLAASPVLKTPC